jgi:purine-binding chemotaxis protein CheW
MSAEEIKQEETLGPVCDVEGKFLTFVLSNQEYGIDILRVVEIVGMMETTPIPRTPGFVKGVINLRGKIIPVIDLRLKFDLEAAEYDEKTCIIVTEINGKESTFPMGIIVDTVSEVISVNSENIEHTPAFGGDFNPEHILAMAKIKDSVKTLLDINSILNESDLSFVESL